MLRQAIIQAVLTAFNRESIMAYLDRSFAVCHGRQEWKSFTIIHLCSAHILKAVSQIIGKNVTDKSYKEFLIFLFARLQNSQTLQEAVSSLNFNITGPTTTTKKSISPKR